MSEYLLDVSDGAAVIEEGCGNGVAQYMRRNRLLDTRPLSNQPEDRLRCALEEPCARRMEKEQLLSIIFAPRQILLQPAQRTWTEKHLPLFIPFSDDLCLAFVEIDLRACERKSF